MADKIDQAARPGLIRRFWKTIVSPSAVLSLGVLTIGGFVVGVFFWGGFHWALEATNTEKFCISCHEMRDNVFAEYEGSVHQSNGSGVCATCPDCHVPKAWGPKLVRKMQASMELYYHFIGRSIDTPEKFAARRLDLASNVWRTMKSTDSRECRNCHNFDFMDFTIQQTRASVEHQAGLDTGKTCIDCHQGIAHDLPAGYLERYREVSGALAAAAPHGAAPQTASVLASLGEIYAFLARAEAN
ncbi:MAG: 4Fe-4S ferredoxin [Alphaproteobacteria bacterium HGW-Alphaproteobacteria-4]|jgi:cytochrome c-type protein NapC|nr:MAG: 4Fe-4S ferredoxin [Alphaproteobacteria bacterium HGW-Alphaproteobacteria-4]